MSEPKEVPTTAEAASPPHPLAELFERWIGRIVAIWLWTVLVGVGGALGLSGGLEASASGLLGLLFNGGGFGRGIGPGGDEVYAIVGPIAAAIGAVASLGAWAYLLIVLGVYIVPVVFQKAERTEAARRSSAGRCLVRAFLLLLVAGVARIVPTLVLFLYPLLMRWGV